MSAGPPLKAFLKENKPKKDVDQGAFKKLAHRVETTMASKCLFPDPRQVPPQYILVSYNNRLGAPPNVPHVHHGILKGFKEKGYDRNRPAIGILVKVTSEAGKKKTPGAQPEVHEAQQAPASLS